MELTLSISHGFRVWIRVRIEDSSRNREKERWKERKLFTED